MTAQRARASNSLVSEAAEHFARALNALQPPRSIAVAVSGGADSMACLLLAIDWARTAGRSLPEAVTVDHGLRKGSLAEARTVAQWARALGCTHTILRWRGKKPEADIQAQAREARYGLLADWSSKEGIDAVLTGHTADDIAETFLMRLARGSGLYGLAAMEPRQPLGAGALGPPWLLRPMLGLSHADAIAVLKAHSQDWIEDPSNQNPRFARVQARNAMATLSGLGLTPVRLARTAQDLARSRDAIETAVETFLNKAAVPSRMGTVSLEAPQMRDVPLDIALRGLASILRCVGGAPYPPRFELTQALHAWIVGGTGPRSRTLGGCLVTRKGPTIAFAREWGALVREMPSATPKPGQAILWDGRFWIWWPIGGKARGISVRVSGEQGLAQIGAGDGSLARKSCPALWKGDDFYASLPLLEPSAHPPSGLNTPAAAYFWPRTRRADGRGLEHDPLKFNRIEL